MYICYLLITSCIFNKEIMKFINILVLTLSLCYSCKAEENRLNVLSDTKWIRETKRKHIIIEFDKNCIHEKIVSVQKKDTLVSCKPYYISNIVPNAFDSSLVGKEMSGIYIIKYNDATHYMEYCEIKELTEDSLVLFYKKQPNNVGGADMTFTYKRVK